MGGSYEDGALISHPIENAGGGGHAEGLGTKVMILHVGWLEAPDPAGVLEITHQLLLLGVDANHGLRAFGKAPFLPGDTAKLLVALGVARAERFAIGVQGVAQFPE